jgi:DNA-binding MarR family transcriptional regulator
LEEQLRQKIKLIAEEIQSKANDPAVNAYTALYLTYDIVDEYADNELGEHQISKAGQNILRILIMNGGSMIATEISKQVWRSKFSVTKVIDTLVKDGYVIRDNPDSDGDRRKKAISITEKGLNVSTKVMKVSTERLCGEVMRGLSQQQIETLSQLLHHIGENTFELVNKSGNSYLFRTV